MRYDDGIPETTLEEVERRTLQSAALAVDLFRAYSKQRARRGRKVRCVETGRVYPTLMDACEATGIHRSVIWRAIDQGVTAGGHHWQYVSNAAS